MFGAVYPSFEDRLIKHDVHAMPGKEVPDFQGDNKNINLCQLHLVIQHTLWYEVALW